MFRKVIVSLTALILLLANAGFGQIIVNNPGDAGPGSLRQAIMIANGTPGFDVIIFQLPGPPFLIMPLSQLPPLTDMAGCHINGLSQPGSFCDGTWNLGAYLIQVELDGTMAGAAHGIYIMSNNNIIDGLNIRNFQQDGICIESAVEAVMNTIDCNYIGTDPSGNFDAGNGTNMASLWAGVYVGNIPGGIIHDNMIMNNLISGNYAEGVAILGPRLPGDVFMNIVQNNRIGTDLTALKDLGNDHEGVCLAEGTHDNSVFGNIISGNGYDGVGIQGYNNLPYYPAPPIQTHHNAIHNNVIGLGLDLITLIPNDYHGVAVGEYGPSQWGCADRNRIESNMIAFNKGDGVAVWEDGINLTNADMNRISGNFIFNNNGLGIDLNNDGVTINDPADPDPRANEMLNFPVITNVTYAAGSTTVTGTVDIDTPPNLATIEIYKATFDPTGYGEGQNGGAFGLAAPDALGNWSVIMTTLSPGDFVSAITIDVNNNTSEFCLAVTVPASSCNCIPGDANGNSLINIQDITYLINFLYKGGSAPTPYPVCSGDANCNCLVNIQDITYLINNLYKSGPAPCNCPTWVGICGPLHQ